MTPMTSHQIHLPAKTFMIIQSFLPDTSFQLYSCYSLLVSMTMDSNKKLSPASATNSTEEDWDDVHKEDTNGTPRRQALRSLLEPFKQHHTPLCKSLQIATVGNYAETLV
jgi:hypothetical protein